MLPLKQLEICVWKSTNNYCCNKQWFSCLSSLSNLCKTLSLLIQEQDTLNCFWTQHLTTLNLVVNSSPVSTCSLFEFLKGMNVCKIISEISNTLWKSRLFKNDLTWHDKKWQCEMLSQWINEFVILLAYIEFWIIIKLNLKNGQGLCTLRVAPSVILVTAFHFLLRLHATVC